MRSSSVAILLTSFLSTNLALANSTQYYAEGKSQKPVKGLSKNQSPMNKNVKRGYIKDKDGLLEPVGPSNHFEIIGALGVADLRVRNSILGVTQDETDKLLPNHKNNWNNFAAQVGVGYVYYFRGNAGDSGSLQWFPLIEPQLNAHFLSRTSIKGDVQLFEIVDSNRVVFDAPVSSTRLMFDTALTVVARSPFSLYAIGGIGNAWNRMKYEDRNIGIDPTCYESIRLNSYTRSNFAWEAGAGLMTNINSRIALSLQYLYADLGKARSSAITMGARNNPPLTLPPIFNLRAQTVTLGLHIAV